MATDNSATHRAQPPQPLPPDENSLARASRLAASERVEHRSLLRGLLLLALIVLAFSILRAGLPRTFVHGWWNQW